MTEPELPLYLPETVGLTLDAPTDIGGAASSTKITGASMGELLFAMSSNPSGGGTRVQRQKAFQANDALTDLVDAVMWIKNLMKQGTGGAKVTRAQSTSSLDGGNYYLRVIGDDASTDAQDEFPLAGNTLASGSIAMLTRHCATLHLDATDQLAPANGWISVYHDDQLVALMPPGAYSITGEIEIGLEDVLDDETTAANAGTDPSGITFSRPDTIANGIAVANGGVLTAGARQGFWIRWTCAEARRASTDVEVYPLVVGDDAG